MSIQTCYEKVWEFRRQYEQFWPTPDPRDSILYAYTEAGEAVSDYLREERTDHRRNHQRQTDVYGELADCAIMLLTALGPGLPPGNDPDEYEVPDAIKDIHVSAIAYLVGSCLIGGYWDVIAALKAIYEFPGMDMEAKIDERLAAIRAKHVEGAYA